LKSYRFKPRLRVCRGEVPSCYTFRVAGTEHFVNDGTGWECRRCRAAAWADDAPGEGPGRFFREGEAEGGGPRLSSRARASWADAERTRLRCPRCGVEGDVGRGESLS
jgi:hypothetical protein